MATPSIRQANDIGTSSRKKRQQLLPGIPDDITLHEISPKLPWKVFYILSAVSRAWGHAIRSRKVYDARVLSHSTEAFVVVNLNISRDVIALWSTRENSHIKLPRIMHRSQLLVAFDGRIYLLGREGHSFATREVLAYASVMLDYGSIFSDEVFALDVAAGERRWRKCASMSEERRRFNGAVLDGKIYVCGGEKIERGTGEKLEEGRVEFCGSEVYDPMKDLWSPIQPMAERYYHQTEAVGEELFVHSGQSKFGENFSSCLNVYHPGKDEWRVVNPFGSSRNHLDRNHLLFIARGKLHSIGNSGIDFYSTEENSWTELHSFSSIEQGGAVWTDDERTAVVYVDDELLIKYRTDDERTAVVYVADELLIKYWVPTGIYDNKFYNEKVCLAKSIGFGSANKEIVWQKVPLTNSLQYTRELISILL